MQPIKYNLFFALLTLVFFAACAPKDANNTAANSSTTTTAPAANNTAAAPAPAPAANNAKLSKFPEQSLPLTINRESATNSAFLPLSENDGSWLENDYNIVLDASSQEFPKAGFRLKISDSRHLIGVIVDAQIPSGIAQTVILQLFDADAKPIGEATRINTNHAIANQYTQGSTTCTFTFSADAIKGQCTEVISDPMGEKKDKTSKVNQNYVISADGITEQ
jgi:hypothetical protein